MVLNNFLSICGGRKWGFEDIPNLDRKVTIVTGASSGLGVITARELARKGAHVFCVGRSEEKTMAVIQSLIQETGNERIEFLQADLMDLSSVKSAAESFLARDLPLHILVNNAGIMGGPFTLSKDGIESQFATNHFAHFYLSLLLLPAMKLARPNAVRIVNVASMAHKMFTVQGGIQFEKMNDSDSYNEHWHYGQTKLANLLFTKELASRLSQASKEHDHIYVNAAHPGVVYSPLWEKTFLFQLGIGKLFMLSPEEGAKTQLFLATDPSIEDTENPIKGKYFVPRAQEQNPSATASDPELAKKLWDFSGRVLKDKGFMVPSLR